MDTKRCTRCSTVKSTSEFYGKTNDRGYKFLAAECKTCTKGRSDDWRSKNHTKANKIAREAQRRLREREPERCEYQWRTSAYKKFGITVEDYDEMLEDQKGVCKICKRTQSASSDRFKRLAVDHDHELGFVRGLLCTACNRHLGYFEQENRLHQLWEYLS